MPFILITSANDFEPVRLPDAYSESDAYIAARGIVELNACPVEVNHISRDGEIIELLRTVVSA